jgi:hypothetical protein
MFSTPILLIIFRRPNTTVRVFESIRKIRPSKIYIASDAPRPRQEDEISKCAEARLITENIDWPCEVKRLYHDVNLGCGLGPRAAFDWFFSFGSFLFTSSRKSCIFVLSSLSFALNQLFCISTRSSTIL